MPLQVNQGGAMPHPAPPINAATHDNTVDIINALSYADIWGGAGTIRTVGNVRMDRQGGIVVGGQNLQVQINGMHGNSTIATVIVAGTVAIAHITVAQQTYAARKVKAAFFDGLNDFENGNAHVYSVTGTPT